MLVTKIYEEVLLKDELYLDDFKNAHRLEYMGTTLTKQEVHAPR